tara:strand:- start:204 stop:1376 length:1173 start_codon:yes stop_codon:yes gene_type:complete
MKYLRYYISTLTLLVGFYLCLAVKSGPTILFLGFSLLIILGDILISEEDSELQYSHPFFLNLPMYINLPLLVLFLLMTISLLSKNIIEYRIISEYLNINLSKLKESFYFFDKVSLVAISSLFIGIMGTVPGHELVHRKTRKFDMFMGNWLLALSWDCAFALEHVYGHHKNVGLQTDPATAKRGENIYAFIFRAIVKEQKDAWNIFLNQSRKNKFSFISIKNKMVIGYLRSLSITIVAYGVGGFEGAMIFLLCAFIAKSLLEVINYTEHYGLVRVSGEKVCPHHSWNSNSVMSSIYLYNVTRHSSHHEKSSLKYWELRPYKGAPMMPYGYLAMLYLAIFLPPVFHKLMSKKLVDWDNKFASKNERVLAEKQNLSSGLPFLQKNSQALDMGI